MKNNTPEEILEKIKESKKVLLTLHTGPDGDSLGSCAAMKYLLEKMGKEARIISNDPLTETLNDIKFSKEVEFGKDVTDIKTEEYDTIILTDISTTEMIGKFKKGYKIPEEVTSICIDHHKTNSHFSKFNYVLPEKVSACSVILDLLKKNNVEINSELATRIFLGIYTDSGELSHKPEAITEAAFLVEKGADVVKEIIYKIKYNVPLRLKKYYSILFQNFKTKEIKGITVGYSSNTLEDTEKLNLNVAEVRTGINELQKTKGPDLFFTLGETEEYIKGSFRTKKDIDVSVLAEALGGGGHKERAAFRLDKKLTLQEAEETVLKTIENLI